MSTSAFVDDYAAAHADLTHVLPSTVVKVATLGPDGTTATEVAELLRATLVSMAPSRALQLCLHPEFESVLTCLLDGEADVALVPSASKGATHFHWHADLQLLFHFVAATPSYGVAVRRQSALPAGTTVSVAVMPEVRAVLDDLWKALGRPEPDVVEARSTRHAGDLLVGGRVDAALTNEPTRERLGLEWITSRGGAQVVWMVFARHADLMSRATRPAPANDSTEKFRDPTRSPR